MKKHFPRSRPGFHLALIPLAIGSSFGPASAQEDNRFYIAPMGTYVLSDDDRHADDGVGGTLAIGAKLGTSVEVELRGTYLDYKGEDDGDEDVDIGAGGLGLNVLLAGPGGPYFHADVMGGDETLFNMGLGYDITLGSSFGIRAEALYHTESNGNVTGDEFKEPLFNLGVRIPFGKAPEPPPPPPAPPPVEVVPVPPPPPVCSDGLDNDSDGFVDFPADKGCETADDGDETDPPPKCKAPEPGQPVSLDGCAVGDTIVLRGVNFDFDKSTLTVNAKTILDGVADALNNRPDIKVEIGGHTDAKGSDEYNLKLSGRRSKSVREYLVKMGVAASRMTSKGYGESIPVADNETDDGRELNRRVELKVTESSGGVTVAPPVPAANAAAVEPTRAATAPAVEAAPEAAPVTAAPEVGGNTVTIANFAFAPAELSVPVGTTVTWTNTDGSAHLVVFADQTSDRMRKGATYTRTFTAVGNYPYTCTLHPAMTGTVVVK